MRKRNRERLKSVILVGLFTLSIGLNTHVGINFSDNNVLNALQKTTPQEVNIASSVKENLVNIISPQRYIVSFGGGLHTIIHYDTHDIWKTLAESIQESYKEENVLEVEYETWQTAKNHKSIELEFDYVFPVKDLGETLKINAKGKVIESLNKVLVSQLDSRVYVADTLKGQYYAISNILNIDDILKKIDNIEKSDYKTYYNIADIYGVNNNNLMPEAFPNVEKIKVEKEIMPTNERQAEAYAETFFGNNLDFIRKIKETSGTIVYMYGYGQRVLRIEDTGRIEYIEEIDPQLSSEKTSLDEAFKVAVNFVSTHGNTVGNKIYLRDIQEIVEQNKDGYSFFFGYKLNNLPLYAKGVGIKSEVVDPIEVRVVGKQVVLYKRIVKNEKNVMKFLEEETTSMLKARQVIDLNFTTIKNDYIQEKPRRGYTVNFKDVSKNILEEIENVEIAYYDYEEKYKNELSPIWIIKNSVKTYYIDAYTGEIVESF
ncbi:hypothetical protein [Anaeromicrobium sediminis]|uniref:Regulatory protein YycH domain-containing protein n=1 Tax=Anaeromicrobium sediminis TaxID=1478221 RepID=A0A267MKQ8_9FIRM|nr:hypothetical protein [Anaeromicrobium sediminis]PAB60169.1 hypothetical protein CCE28_07305 [Anaeromicrobium sediminis]